MKLHIHIEEGIGDTIALEYVQIALRQGKVSETRGIKHYSHITTFKDGTAVACRPNSENSFQINVWKEHGG